MCTQPIDVHISFGDVILRLEERAINNTTSFLSDTIHLEIYGIMRTLFYSSTDGSNVHRLNGACLHNHST